LAGKSGGDSGLLLFGFLGGAWPGLLAIIMSWGKRLTRPVALEALVADQAWTPLRHHDLCVEFHFRYCCRRLSLFLST